MKSIRHTITRACLGAVLSLSMAAVPVYSSIGNVYAYGDGNNSQTVTAENDSAKNYSSYDKNSDIKNNGKSNYNPPKPKPDPGKKNNNNGNKKPSGGSKNNGGGKNNGGNRGGNGGGGGGSFNTSMMNGGGLPSASRLSAKDRQIAENLLGQKIPGDSSNASGKITINGGTATTTETKSYAQVSKVKLTSNGVNAFGPSSYHWYTWTKDKSMAGMSGGYNAAVAGTYSPANSGTTGSRTRQYTSDRAVWMAVLGDPMYNNTITMTATQSAEMVTTTKTTRIDQVVKTVNNDNLKAVYGRGVTYNIKTTLSGKDKTDNQKAKQKRTSYVASGNDTFSKAKEVKVTTSGNTKTTTTTEYSTVNVSWSKKNITTKNTYACSYEPDGSYMASNATKKKKLKCKGKDDATDSAMRKAGAGSTSPLKSKSNIVITTKTVTETYSSKSSGEQEVARTTVVSGNYPATEAYAYKSFGLYYKGGSTAAHSTKVSKGRYAWWGGKNPGYYGGNSTTSDSGGGHHLYYFSNSAGGAGENVKRLNLYTLLTRKERFSNFYFTETPNFSWFNLDIFTNPGSWNAPSSTSQRKVSRATDGPRVGTRVTQIANTTYDVMNPKAPSGYAFSGWEYTGNKYALTTGMTSSQVRYIYIDNGKLVARYKDLGCRPGENCPTPPGCVGKNCVIIPGCVGENCNPNPPGPPSPPGKTTPPGEKIPPDITNRKYTLTIDPNGGKYGGSSQTTKITKEQGSSSIIGRPTRDGYIFTGWEITKGDDFTPLDGGKEYLFIYNADGGVRAKWTPADGTGRLITNPGPGCSYAGPLDVTKKAGDTQYVNDKPSCPGKTFTGWKFTGSGDWEPGKHLYTFYNGTGYLTAQYNTNNIPACKVYIDPVEALNAKDSCSKPAPWKVKRFVHLTFPIF